MDWILEIIKKYTNEEGKVDLEKVNKEIKTEFPKNAVPKETFNEKNEDLKAANKLVNDLKKDNKDIEDLQKKIDDYEKDIETLKEERVKERTNFTLKEKLKEAGAKDVDYMIYKLGEVEVDKEGNIIELDNKIKSLLEENKDHFEVKDDKDDDKDNKDDGKGKGTGFQVIDNKLDDGKEPDANQKAMTEFEEALGLTKQ